MESKLTRYSINLRPPLTSPFSFLIRRLKSLPSRQIKSSPGWMMPHLAAMALAVLMLSPVTIRTVMPARWHLRMASGTLEDKEVCSQKYITIVFLTAELHYGVNKRKEPIQIPTIPKHMLALKSHTFILTLEKVYSLSKRTAKWSVWRVATWCTQLLSGHILSSTVTVLSSTKQQLKDHQTISSQWKEQKSSVQ